MLKKITFSDKIHPQISWCAVYLFIYLIVDLVYPFVGLLWFFILVIAVLSIKAILFCHKWVKCSSSLAWFLPVSVFCYYYLNIHLWWLFAYFLLAHLSSKEIFQIPARWPLVVYSLLFHTILYLIYLAGAMLKFFHSYTEAGIPSCFQVFLSTEYHYHWYLICLFLFDCMYYLRHINVIFFRYFYNSFAVINSGKFRCILIHNNFLFCFNTMSGIFHLCVEHL